MLTAQFGCITFHSSRYRGWAKLTPTEEQVDKRLGWQLVLLQGALGADG
jgi:hypothetical protein